VTAVPPPLPQGEFTVDALKVRVYANSQELAQAAANEVRQHLRGLLATQPVAAIVLATATSQIQFLENLTSPPGMDWSRILFFHLSEYLGLSADHHASFRRFLREHVVEKVKSRLVHYLEGDTLQPLDECDRYARLLRAQPIDVGCLGIGENGHLAFNDPAVADFADPRTVKVVKLDLKSRMQQVGEGCFPHLPAVPQYGFTLTIAGLCSARRVFCIVPEKRKAQAVRDALRGPIHPSCPASILRQHPHATLFLDADSASFL
jgi:glucosamine-6-phosphate deaminase